MTSLQSRSTARLPDETTSNCRSVLWVVVYILGMVLTVLSWTAVFTWLADFVPKFEDIFRDFGMSPSAAARLSFSASSWFNGSGTPHSTPGWVILIPFVVLVGAALSIVGWRERTRRQAATALMILAIGGIISLAVSYGSMYLMLTEMHASLQGGKL